MKERDKLVVAVRPPADDFEIKIDLGGRGESEMIHMSREAVVTASLFPALRPGFFLVAVLAQLFFALVLIHFLLALFSRPRHI